MSDTTTATDESAQYEPCWRLLGMLNAFHRVRDILTNAFDRHGHGYWVSEVRTTQYRQCNPASLRRAWRNSHGERHYVLSRRPEAKAVHDEMVALYERIEPTLNGIPAFGTSKPLLDIAAHLAVAKTTEETYARIMTDETATAV
jgi:hypothetical protein